MNSYIKMYQKDIEEQILSKDVRETPIYKYLENNSEIDIYTISNDLDTETLNFLFKLSRFLCAYYLNNKYKNIKILIVNIDESIFKVNLSEAISICLQDAQLRAEMYKELLEK